MGAVDMCCRVIFFMFNLVFFLCGLGLMGLCLWVRFDPRFSSYIVFVDDGTTPWLSYVLKGTLYGLIGIGAFVAISGFLGCCGAVKQSRWMIGLYMTLLIIVMIVELGGGIMAVVYRQKIETAMDGSLLGQIRNSYGSAHPITAAIDRLQTHTDCCGSRSFGDYERSLFASKNPEIKVPDSCCNVSGAKTEHEQAAQIADCQKEATNKFPSKYLRSQGCLTRIVEAGRHMSLYLLAVGFGVVVFEIFSLSTAVCILHAARKVSGFDDDY